MSSPLFSSNVPNERYSGLYSARKSQWSRGVSPSALDQQHRKGAWRKQSITYGGSPFKRLPDNSVLQIMKLLSAKDMLALSMTNKTIRRCLVDHPALWIFQARANLALSIPLVIPRHISDDDRVVTVYNFPLIALRSAVLATSVLSDAWSGALAVPIAQPSLAKLGILRDNSRCGVIRVTPRHYLVVRDDLEAGHGAQELIGWDTRQDLCVGRVRLGMALVSWKPEWTTGSWYFVAGTRFEAGEFGFAIARVQLRETAVQSPLSSAIEFVPIDMGAVNDAINDVNSPALADESDTSPNTITSEVFARFKMPCSVGMEVHIVAPKRLVAVLFECGTRRRRLLGRYTDEGTPTSTLGLVLIVDWKTGLSTVVDTGIAFSHCCTSATFHLSPNRSNLVVRTETCHYIDDDVPAGRRSVLRVHEKLLDLDQVKRRAKNWGETIAEASTVKEGRHGAAVRRVMDANAIRRNTETEVDVTAEAGGGRIALDETQTDYEWGEGAMDALMGGIRTPPARTRHFERAVRFLRRLPAQAHTPILELDRSEFVYMRNLHEDWPGFRNIDGSSGEFERGGAHVNAPTTGRSSRVTLYSIPQCGYTACGVAGGKVWYLLHSYVVAGMEANSSSNNNATHAATSPPPIIVPLRSPVLVEDAIDLNHNTKTRFRPLLAISYNYVCWVEEVAVGVDESMDKKNGKKVLKWRLKSKSSSGSSEGTACPTDPRRVLKIASFRGPEDSRLTSACGSNNKIGVATVTTLDIPDGDNILHDIEHLFVCETDGTVSVTSVSGEIYTYPFV